MQRDQDMTIAVPKPSIQFCGALGPVSPTSSARAAAPAINDANDSD